jgi:hypothetical protein
MWVVSFTPRPIYPRYSLGECLDEPQSRSERGGEQKSVTAPAENRTPVVQLVA